MSNDYYTPTGSPATSSSATSSTMRNEFNDIEDGFDKLPSMTGKSELPVFVNTGETAQEAVSIATALTRLGLGANLDTFTLPANTTISAFIKTVLDDADAATVRATLGLIIGTNIQAYDAFLASIAALGTGANKMVYITGVNTAAETALTAFARTILDDANAAAVIATLGIDADITTLSLPASTTISAYGKTLIDDASAAAALSTLGLTAAASEINNGCDGLTTTAAEINAMKAFVNGRKFWIYANTAPTAWNIVATTTDAMLACKGGSNAYNTTGGQQIGTWTISGLAADSHVLTISEMPAHDHPIKYSRAGGTGPYCPHVDADGNVEDTTNTTAIQNTGGGTGHVHGVTHTPAWRPLANLGIVIEKT